WRADPACRWPGRASASRDGLPGNPLAADTRSALAPQQVNSLGLLRKCCIQFPNFMFGLLRLFTFRRFLDDRLPSFARIFLVAHPHRCRGDVMLDEQI